MKKITVFGIGFTLLMFFLNLIGCYDFVMVITRNQAYFAEHYSPAIEAYFTNYPLFFLILWISNLLGGILTPMFYLFKKKSAFILAGLAFWTDAILILLTSLFRNRIQLFGWQFVFDLLILGLFGVYYMYLRSLVKGNTL
ncbi:hypothetical protein [Streptococcus dentiloxodontae]